MSGTGFHVHGPHDHAVEHAAHGGSTDRFGGRMAVVTAVLATLGALFSYMGGATQAQAGLLKNDAAIRKTEASNQWNYYQAKSSRQYLGELASALLPPDKARFYEDEVNRYKSEKAEIKKLAEGLEAQSRELENQSAEQMHQHHRWAQATTALQVAIAMAAIALLTRRKWLASVVLGVGGVGLVLGALAWLHV